MGLVGNPNSDGVNAFPGRYRSGMPDDRDELRFPRAFTFRTADPFSSL